MRRTRDFDIFKWVAAVCVGVVGLCMANVSAAPHARYSAILSLAGGNHVLNQGRAPEPYTFSLFTHYTLPEHEDPPGGGLGVFGAMDTGEVQLMHHIQYVPNLTESFTDRRLYPPKAIIRASYLPLYIMVCAWTADDDMPSEPVFQFYTEREDANATLTEARLGATWRTISSRRAKDKFAALDYCGELSKTRKSSAPLWLPATEY